MSAFFPHTTHLPLLRETGMTMLTGEQKQCLRRATPLSHWYYATWHMEDVLVSDCWLLQEHTSALRYCMCMLTQACDNIPHPCLKVISGGITHAFLWQSYKLLSKTIPAKVCPHLPLYNQYEFLISAHTRLSCLIA